MIDNSGGSTWMSESVTHSRPSIRSESADHFAGGTTPIVSRMLAQGIRFLPGLMERRRAKPIICSVLTGKQLASLKLQEYLRRSSGHLTDWYHGETTNTYPRRVIRQFAVCWFKAAML